MKLEITHRVAIDFRDLAPLIRELLQSRLPQYDLTKASLELPDGKLIVSITEAAK